jgi:hypothetical protein
MTDRETNDQLAERQDEATDKRTLNEIEDEEELSTGSDSPAPSPDEGGGRSSDDDAGAPM